MQHRRYGEEQHKEEEAEEEGEGEEEEEDSKGMVLDETTFGRLPVSNPG